MSELNAPSAGNASAEAKNIIPTPDGWGWLGIQKPQLIAVISVNEGVHCLEASSLIRLSMVWDHRPRPLDGRVNELPRDSLDVRATAEFSGASAVKI